MCYNDLICKTCIDCYVDVHSCNRVYKFIQHIALSLDWECLWLYIQDIALSLDWECLWLYIQDIALSLDWECL